MIHFIFGTDQFRSHEKLKNLIKTAKKSTGINLSLFDFEESSEISSFLNAFSSGGLFSEKSLIVAKNLLTQESSENQKKVANHLENINLHDRNDIILIIWEKQNPKKNLTLFKFLSKHSKTYSYEPLEGSALTKWANETYNSFNSKNKLSPKIINDIVSLTGNDLHLLFNELQKIANFSDLEHITEKDISLLVRSQASFTIFETIEAFLKKDKKQALLLFHNQIKQGEDPFYILSMYVYQIRAILKIAQCVEKNIYDQYLIAKETGLHPFVVKKSLPQARLISIQKLKAIFFELQNIDRLSKTGKTDITTSLDILITKM